jgi:hypothetical protein
MWGTIGLPLLAHLYVRQKNLSSVMPWYKVKFRTKLEQAADLVEWAAGLLKYLEKSLWIVVDGAYAKWPFLKRALAAGTVVVSRLRKDAALWSVPQGAAAADRASMAKNASVWPSVPATAVVGCAASSSSTARW